MLVVRGTYDSYDHCMYILLSNLFETTFHDNHVPHNLHHRIHQLLVDINILIFLIIRHRSNSLSPQSIRNAEHVTFMNDRHFRLAFPDTLVERNGLTKTITLERALERDSAATTGCVFGYFASCVGHF